nr:MAG TPA: hypothetical protein [Caudoviricetes sp.]
MINTLNNATSSLLVSADVLEITNSSTKFYVAAVDSGYNVYSYTTDDAVIQDISNNGYIKVGYYRVSILP